MATKGPQDREQFAQRGETGFPQSSSRRDLVHQKWPKVVLGGSMTEALCGVATIILAIIGLAGAFRGSVASVATIVFGAALLAHGGALTARYKESAPYDATMRTELGGGMGAEIIGGAAGVVLGILALVGLATGVLVSIAVIVFGVSLVMASRESDDLGMYPAPGAHERLARFAHQAMMAASGTQALAGAGAIVLGIIALLGVHPVMLTLVALLVLGSSVVLSGAASSSRIAAITRR